MTGPEHYQEAERLLQVAGVGAGLDPRDPVIVAAAQVHATLALVALTAEASTSTEYHALGRPLVQRPTAADDWEGGDPAFPGTPWGRAIHGERVSA